MPLVSQSIRDKIIFYTKNDAIMVVVSAPAVDNIWELLTHNLLTQAQGKVGYVSVNNLKHGGMDDDSINCASDTPARGVEFTELKTKNDNLFTQLRQQEYQI